MGVIKIVFFVGLIVIGLFLFAGSGLYSNLVGMVSSSDTVDKDMYTCTDNDGRNTKPQTTHGTVRVSAPSSGVMEVYTDFCINDMFVREFLCDPDTNRQTYHDYSCTELGTKCRSGRCFAWP
ncbi:hypothetical protein COV17_00110 [Candidatus Woesearchaeota archaeon CG10_big_fil_rev_8_21_14_0_10_36_11]|nr:MAG: hypothetical protein COV17_00110 [Candidatus Woesearchaeota archaeon CG10_big_fil_rev_8_21_14_0_10_36_11]